MAERRDAGRERRERPPPPSMEREPPAEDPVDRTIADSFPASDPPQWWAGVPRERGRDERP